MLDLSRVPELGEWGTEDGWLRIGAGVPYTQLIAELGDQLPGLAIASRTVGSPQIRNRGTVGGNLGTSSPAGDGLPPLYACGAEVELASVDGTRRVAVGDFITGPKRNCLASDELIAAFWIKPADGPQEFSKVGTRNAMVIAVCSFALNDLARAARGHDLHRLGGPDADPRRARPRRSSPACSRRRTCGTRRRRSRRARSPASASWSSEAARPIDDVRGTADYRRHALRVLGRRALTRAWNRHVEEVSR